MITSTSNAKVKNIVQLQKKMKVRREQDAFVVEGLKMFVESPREQIKEIYVTPAFLEREKLVLQDHSYEVVDERVFAQMSDTITPQGILCVVGQMHYTLEAFYGKSNPFLMILENLQDPGNVGTIFRTAEGAGADGVILSRDCVDIYNPKTIRGTMGSIYRVPFLYVEDLHEVLYTLHKNNIWTYAAHLDGKQMYDRENYTLGTAFLIGNEGNGLSSELVKETNCLIKIPMEGQLESLNASVASGVLMYEVQRQRREFKQTQERNAR
jgi:TrmH family RNA methyltransferase